MDIYKMQANYFKVLMHPTRLAILDILRSGEQCVCHMEAVLGLRQAHISQHLMVLRESGLVTDRRDGWNIFYRIVKPNIFEVVDAMADFCGVAGKTQSQTFIHPPLGKTCTCPNCTAVASSEGLGIPTKELIRVEESIY